MKGSRPALAERVQALRADGATHKQIAAALGISRSYSNELVSDPTGERGRIRKLGYRGTCERCGGPTDGSNGPRQQARHCAACAATLAHEQRRWHPEAILEAIRRFAEENGRPPLSAEWFGADRGAGCPSTGTVLGVFGSWAAGIEAAGFRRPRVGDKVRLPAKTTLVCEECARPFDGYRARFCSTHCSDRQRRRTNPWRRPRRTPIERECRQCGKPFRAEGCGQSNRRRCFDCQPVGVRQRPQYVSAPRSCSECDAIFTATGRGGRLRRRCYTCLPAGTWRAAETPRQIVCVNCGEQFTTRHVIGQGARLRCYACLPVGASGPVRARPRDVTCIECGEQFTTRPGYGQGRRVRCYTCHPTAAPGQSKATLKRARRRQARETPAA